MPWSKSPSLQPEKRCPSLKLSQSSVYQGRRSYLSVPTPWDIPWLRMGWTNLHWSPTVNKPDFTMALKLQWEAILTLTLPSCPITKSFPKQWHTRVRTQQAWFSVELWKPLECKRALTHRHSHLFTRQIMTSISQAQAKHSMLRQQCLTYGRTPTSTTTDWRLLWPIVCWVTDQNSSSSSF